MHYVVDHIKNSDNTPALATSSSINKPVVEKAMVFNLPKYLQMHYALINIYSYLI